MIGRALSVVSVAAIASLVFGATSPAIATTVIIEFSDFTPGDTFPNASLPTTLEINGELLSFVDSALAGSDTHSVGGVSVHSAGVVGGARSATLEGPISTIAFVGQELLIDGVHLTLIPEPSAWVLLVLGAISVIALIGRQRIVGRAPRAW